MNPHGLLENPASSNFTSELPARSSIRPSHHYDSTLQFAESHSSVVDDYGDAKYLTENRKPRSTFEGFQQPTAAELVAHAGAGFSTTAEPSQDFIEELGSQGNGESLTQAKDLGRSIREAFQISAGRDGGREFLPIEALHRIITKQRIRLELAKILQKHQSDRLDHLVDQIWKVQSTVSSPTSIIKKTTRLKIFAILALCAKLEDIMHFIKGELYDSDLPFVLSSSSGHGLRDLERKEGAKHYPIQLFSTWPPHLKEFFADAQWKLMAPYFHLSTKSEPKILHYNLDAKAILPFVEKNESQYAGGFSDLLRVKIHPANHNCCEDSAPTTENPSYAVKRLLHFDADAFHSEVSNLKRFSKKDHLHLMKLLATYTWQEQYCLLFPWADGNLLDFWKRYPFPNTPTLDYDSVLWFSEQCLGIAEGLKMIHTADKPDAEGFPDPNHPVHGRHGDLKPENILWFKDYPNKSPNSSMGVLKISDFGLTRFHRTASKSGINAETVGNSPTYRAPEYDVTEAVGQSYDIWTLGCVLLEFATWLLCGWEEVDNFSKSRTKEDLAEMKQDNFFVLVDIRKEDGQRQRGAKAKKSVAKEFDMLYDKPNCSDFLVDVLNFIKDRLLRMGPHKRAGCDVIVDRFREFHERCLQDSKYCTLRREAIPVRHGTDLSLLEATPIHVSSEQGKRTSRSIPVFPLHDGPVENDDPVEDGEYIHHEFQNDPSGSSKPRVDESEGVGHPGMTVVSPGSETVRQTATETISGSNITATPTSSTFEFHSRPQSPIVRARAFGAEISTQSQSPSKKVHFPNLISEDDEVGNEDDGHTRRMSTIGRPEVKKGTVGSVESAERGPSFVQHTKDMHANPVTDVDESGAGPHSQTETKRMKNSAREEAPRQDGSTTSEGPPQLEIQDQGSFGRDNNNSRGNNDDRAAPYSTPSAQNQHLTNGSPPEKPVKERYSPKGNLTGELLNETRPRSKGRRLCQTLCSCLRSE